MSGILGSTRPTSPTVIGGIFTLSNPAPVDGQPIALQLDSVGNLLVNVAVGGAGGGSNLSVGLVGVNAPTSATEIGIVDALGKLQNVSLTNPLPITGSISATNPSVGITGVVAPLSATEIGVIDGTGNLQGVSSSNPVRVDPTGVTTQPVSIASAVDVSDRSGRLLGHVTVDNASLAVIGTFFQATQPVSIATAIDVSDRTARLLGHVTVDNASLAVIGTFFQATQPVSIAAAVDVSDRAARLLGVVYGSQGQQLKQTAVNFNLQTELATGGTLYDARQIRALTSSDVVTVVQPTAANLNATVIFASSQHVIVDSGSVSISGTVSDDVTDRAARLLGHVTVDNASLAVTGTFFQATQPVSISATISDDVVDRAARLLGHVTVDNFPGTQAVSGSVSISNFPVTQPISAVSLPLPTGASTDSSLIGGNDISSQQLLVLESMRRALVALACEGGRNNPRDFDPGMIAQEEGVDDYAD